MMYSYFLGLGNVCSLIIYSHAQKLFTFTKQVLSKPVSRKIISPKIG